MTHRTIISLLTLALMSMLARPAHADSITLRPGAAVPADRPVTVGDVAMLVGEHAQSHAAVVVVPHAGKAALGRVWIEVSLKDLRNALQDAGVNPAPIAMSGSSCVVRLLGSAEPMLNNSSDAPETNEARVVLDEGPATIRLRVAQALSRLYGVPLDDLRLLFDERDNEFLDQLELGRRVVVMTGTSANSARQGVNVRIYTGESVDQACALGVSVELRRDTIVVANDVARKAAITPSDVSVRRMWVEGGGAALLTDVSDAIGAVARTDLKAGTIIRANQLESPILVRRGALVRVQCLSGGIALQMQARARGSGKKGEVIEVRREGSANSFMARIDGNNSVVLELGGTPVASDN
ncbi:MAG: flagellar basal body P-ring formation chaperone FlgA [Phycisphaerales bacterium]|nr:flagellar basal body P-ring formation protein FlgA [Phycisphaerales bacterium]